MTSHPQALAQCDEYIRRHKYSVIAATDTAGSARMVGKENLPDTAAIASEIAASYYGLDILDSNIEDDSNNFTRFILLAPTPAVAPEPAEAKTSIVFTLGNATGALFKV